MSIADFCGPQELFEPVELLERLAALTARPRINLLLYCGVLGARSAWRSRLRTNDAQEDGLVRVTTRESCFAIASGPSRQELRIVQEEREILKNAAAFFARQSR